MSRQQCLFNSPEVVKGQVRKVFAGLDNKTAAFLLSRLVLDQIRALIDKFPDQIQKEMVALLTDGYLEKWSKEKE